MKQAFNPNADMVGGFSANDGTIDFYLRIRHLIKNSDTVLDLGAGRGEWYEDDDCRIRVSTRLLKNDVKCLIAADVDPVVLEHNASHNQVVISADDIGMEQNSIDLIVADYVLEHVQDPSDFVNQVERVLKPGGWLCARTPHKYNYVSCFARIIGNKFHTRFLETIQPKRKEKDIFPTFYKMNDMKSIRSYFYNWNNYSFVYRGEPSYFGGNRIVWKILSISHRLFFKEFCGNMFVFVQKPRSQ